MKNKVVLGIIIAVVISLISYFGIKLIVPPQFEIENTDWESKSGTFSFDNKKEYFDIYSFFQTSRIYGFNIMITSKDKIVMFDLYKNGVFVKHLQKVDYNTNQVHI